ncbi:hypothetical protein ONZ45_g18835 [Pleurotus djamor]|nr:hypothetical protein ONZ45_g18835 [Pleurotus djamor]
MNPRQDSSDERASLLSVSSTNSYGAAQPTQPNSRKVLFNATLRLAAIFVAGTVILGGALWLALPTLEPDDRPMLRIPKSFEQLQQLNYLLKKYRDIYPFRIVISYVVTYLFGATLCYLLSAAIGPALLTVPRIKSRLDSLGDRIRANKENIFSFLIVIRIAPLPPHWVVNVVCPHVGIGIIPFWCSTWLGILGVTVIHTTIGGGLDDMTSPDDFKLISWKNFFGLSAVVIGVMIPVGLRYWFGKKVSVEDLEQPADVGPVYLDGEDTILAVGPPVPPNSKGLLKRDPADGQIDPYEDDDESSDDDEDIILEAGPAIDIDGKGKSPRQPSPEPVASSSRSSSR